MNIEIRNEYGFPIMAKLENARKYAAEAKERNKASCACEACRQAEMLPAVQNIINNWGNQ